MNRITLSLLLCLAGTIGAAPPAPVTSLAYHPTNQFLVAGTYGEAVFISPKTGAVLSRITGLKQRVTSVRFSTDGKLFAVASGEPGKNGVVQLYRVESTTAQFKPLASFTGHTDLVYALDFSPDGKQLASAGYDRLIRLWNTDGPATAEPVQILKDHSDTVYGLSWHPAGKLLASAGADRAVKVWDVASGKRLYTLGDPTDWVYAVTWHPKGKLLAAAGVDKSIRVWEADAEAGKLVNSVFAHTAPVTKLIYTKDGKSLYSISEGKNIKRWDTAKMVEQLVFPPQPETMLSLAVSPDGTQVAVGRFDGVLQLLDQAGKLISQPLPVKPNGPQINQISPLFSPRGKTVRLTIEGTDLLDGFTIESTVPGVTFKPVPGGSWTKREVDLTLPEHGPVGSIPIKVTTPYGTITTPRFYADRYPVVLDSNGNESSRRGQTIQLPATVVGQLSRAGEADYYRFSAKAGEEIGVQVILSTVGSKMEPVLELTDSAGNVLAEGTKSLGFKIPSDGAYAIGIRDQEFRAGSDFTYRLHLGNVPVVTHVFPLGVPRGQQSTVRLSGVNLPQQEVAVNVPTDAVPGSRVPLVLPQAKETPLGDLSVIVGEFPEIQQTSDKLPVPGTGNGTIAVPGQTDSWNFTAKKGQPLILEVNARRTGSKLDSYLEILDTRNKPVGRATLRCVARTFVTFRDHDSVNPNIRLETWNELAMGDYVYVGTELLRIFNLPPNPDADCTFYSVNGQRQGQLDTTPGHQYNGAPMYKVEIHPPGTTFPPNGMPVFHLNYRNDDGGALYGKDSKITFDPPADGEYRVRIGDSRGKGQADFGYRLTVRAPRPDFTVTFNPTSPVVWKGGSIPVSASVTRLDGFQGAVKLKLINLPIGFDAPETFIEEGQASANFPLYANSMVGAVDPKTHSPMKLIATANINGQVVSKEVVGGVPTVQDPGDIVTTTFQDAVTLKPGSTVKMRVKIERRNGFTGRIPLEVRGLPYGVRVLDIGLNGILITEKDTERDVVIFAEPWVLPKEMPFVVLAKREGKGTEHGAKSILLKIEK